MLHNEMEIDQFTNPFLQEQFPRNCTFSRQFRKNWQISNFEFQVLTPRITIWTKIFELKVIVSSFNQHHINLRYTVTETDIINYGQIIDHLSARAQTLLNFDNQKKFNNHTNKFDFPLILFDNNFDEGLKPAAKLSFGSVIVKYNKIFT